MASLNNLLNKMIETINTHTDAINSGEIGGGVSSWNDLTDKPFYSETVEGIPVFDGDLTKEEIYDLNGGKLIRKSDTPLTIEEMIGTYVNIEINAPALGVDGDHIMQFNLTEDDLNLSKLDDDNYSILAVNNKIGVPVGLVVHGDMSELYGIAIPEGVYYMYMPEEVLGTTGSYCYTYSMSCLYGPMEEIHPIDEKYLPDTVATKAYVEQLLLVDETEEV